MTGKAKRAIERAERFFRDKLKNFPTGSRVGSGEIDSELSKWTGLELFSAALNVNAHVFGPLKEATDMLVSLVDTFEKAAVARKDFQDLKHELDGLLGIIRSYFDIPNSFATTSSIKNLALGIKRETDFIEQLRQGAGMSRFMNASQEAEDILRCYRRINGLFQRLMLNMNLQLWGSVDKLAMENCLQRLPHSDAAFYCSADAASLRRGKCTPNTRVEFLQDLHDWATSSSNRKIYWLNGMAGTGKTTIAYSLCEQLETKQTLAASFFCSRQLPECRNVNRIVPTIAYQLSRFSLPFWHSVTPILKDNPDVYNRSILEQFEYLVFRPLSQVKDALPTDLVIVVDALDECDAETGVLDILDALLSHAPNLPLKIFVTSRPDGNIVYRMRQRHGERVSTEVRLHELAHLTVQGDIRTYLKAELEPYLPVSSSELDALVAHSGVLFIYAATVVRYVKAQNNVRARKRLAEVLRVTVSPSSLSNRMIDTLYTDILGAAYDNDEINDLDRYEMLLMLHTVICICEPLCEDHLAGLLNLDNTQSIRASLFSLLSVLHVQETTGIITTLHESFRDYLLDHQRSGRFHCDIVKHNARLAKLCFHHISKTRPFNICNLASSYMLDSDVVGLDEIVNAAISGELLYACCYWDSHVVSSNGFDAAGSLLLRFLSERLLVWMEIMNLKGRFARGIQMLYEANRLMKDYEWLDEAAKLLIQDGLKFMTACTSGSVLLSTPHLYISALLFWAADHPIRRRYSLQLPDIIGSDSTAMEVRSITPLAIVTIGESTSSISSSPNSVCLASGSFDGSITIWNTRTGQQLGQSLEGHSGCVSSVAYSPDGTHIVSGSWDNTVRTWNAQSGQQVGKPLEGHTGVVTSVKYSPDGLYVVSGSCDRTVRIWDARNRRQVGKPLEGHTHGVNSVAYSPDGLHIVSGSLDGTVRIWDVRTSQQVAQPLEGHSDSVNSVAYSPDGAYVVSGSNDYSVHIWDTYTRQQVGRPLQGHTNNVSSVTYSPDGAYIVSGSWGGTVRIWDAHVGRQIGQPLVGHNSYVNSVSCSHDGAYIISESCDNTVCIWDTCMAKQTGEPLEGHFGAIFSIAYSPDGAHIVSASWDNTVRIWNAQNGQQVGKPLEGHTGVVTSVKYSPDGLYVVSGSCDRTVRIWDARNRRQVGEPLEGHTNHVRSVAYSPDGAYIASGSSDCTMRIWDTHTMKQVGKPLEGHSYAVNSVAYSPNGIYLVSGSDDNTVRIWDTRTGQQVGHPLEGHTSYVNSVLYSPDGAYVVSGSDDNTVRIWDVRAGYQPIQVLKGHSGEVVSLAYSPNGSHVVSGSWDKTTRIWDTRTGEQVGQAFEGHTDRVSSIAYSPDGAHIVSSSYDHTIRFCNVEFSQAISRSLMTTNCANPSTGTPLSVDLFNLQNKQLGSHICSSACQNTGLHLPWRLNEEGWVVLWSGELLVWIPPDLRRTLLRPHNSVIASSQHGVLKLQFDPRALGSHWAKHVCPPHFVLR